MKVEKLIVGQLQTNCYLVWEKKTKKGLIIDPGDDAEYIISRIKDLGIKPQMILATHGHFDHVLAAFELKLAFKIPFLINRHDFFLLKRTNKTADWFTGIKDGFTPLPDAFLKENKRISFGQNSQLRVIETPGHSPGGVAFFSRGALFSGDTLFKQGVGRSDFSYCSKTDLMNSIKNKLFKLPNKTVVYPGHGEKTTIVEEKRNFSLATKA
jgi:hydroxyacylglutathione hydrolase